MGIYSVQWLVAVVMMVVVVAVREGRSQRLVWRQQGEGDNVNDGGHHGKRVPFSAAVQVKKWFPLQPAVRQMAVRLPLTEILPQPERQKVHSDTKVKDIGFNWKSCGPADQLVDILNLTIAPSPLFFPGQLSFGFDILFHDSILDKAKVSADLTLEYSARTGTWVKIPCVGQIGSCTYDDVCSLSQAIVCPDELRQRGIPCTCPINKGEYKLPPFTVDVLASVFLSGDYRAKAVFTDSVKGQIACYQVTFTVG